jgi:hypothetical protein
VSVERQPVEVSVEQIERPSVATAFTGHGEVVPPVVLAPSRAFNSLPAL